MTARMATSLLLSWFSAAALAQSSGTGFFVSASGHLVTAYHVIEGAEDISVRDAHGVVHPATLVRADPANDLAVLKVQGNFQTLPIALSTSARRGTEVFTVGYPNVDIQGIEPKVTHGIVSALSGIQDDTRFFQISTPVQPGNSGGPLLNRNGEVVGVVAHQLNALRMIKYRGNIPQNVNFAIKSVFLIEILRSIQGLDFTPANVNQRASSRTFEQAVADAEKATVLIFAKTSTPVSRASQAPQVSRPRQTARDDRGGPFGAIAYSKGTGSHGWAKDYSSRDAAEREALSNCSEHASDCEAVLSFRSACGVLALGPRGAGWAWHTSARLAVDGALKECVKWGRGCTVKQQICTTN